LTALVVVNPNVQDTTLEQVLAAIDVNASKNVSDAWPKSVNTCVKTTWLMAIKQRAAIPVGYLSGV